MSRRCIAALLFGLLFAPAAFAAPEAIAVHSGWAAMRDGGRCYAIGRAMDSPTKGTHQPYGSIAIGSGGPTFRLNLSRRLSRGAVVTLDVGQRRFRLSGDLIMARPRSERDNREILSAMRNSATMTVGARDARGLYFRDRYSLVGAPTAIDEAIMTCGA